MAGVRDRVVELSDAHLSDSMIRKLKYGAVSMINVPFGQAILAVCVSLLGWAWWVGNLTAVAITTPVAYVLNRAWVWGRQGGHDLWSDVAPFWGMALFGLVATTLVLGWAEDQWSQPWVANLASLVTFGVIWVGKYLVLDRLMFGRDPAPADG